MFNKYNKACIEKAQKAIEKRLLKNECDGTYESVEALLTNVIALGRPAIDLYYFKP